MRRQVGGWYASRAGSDAPSGTSLELHRRPNDNDARNPFGRTRRDSDPAISDDMVDGDFAASVTLVQLPFMASGYETVEREKADRIPRTPYCGVSAPKWVKTTGKLVAPRRELARET